MPEPAPDPGRRKRWLWRGLALLAVAGVAVWMTRALWYGVAVTVAAPTRGTAVETIVSSGRVLAPSQTPIGSTLVGTVRAVAVDEGDRVVAGQVLVQLDDAEARAAVARAQASLDGLAARRLDLLERRAPSVSEQLRQARVSLAQAEADHTRDASLAQGGALTTSELERSATALALARSKVRAAAIEARAATPKGAESAELDALEADARAALAAAELRVGQHALCAPVAGVVLQRTVEAGQVVQPGVPLLVLAEAGPDRIVIEPDEKNLRVLALGQPAVAAADAYPERRFPVTVAWIAAGIDARRGTVAVHLALAEPQPFLKADMTVSVEIEVARKADALTVPRALVQDLATDAPWVMLVDGAHARRQPVTLGLRGDAVVEVTAGVAATSRLIVPAPGLPSEGARVRVPAAAGE